MNSADSWTPEVLIVEDEALIALVIDRQLSLLGCRVIARVATAEAALDLLEEKRLDLILFDVRLAGRLTGIEAASRIRARADRAAATPIVFMTAYGTSEVKASAESLRPLAFLEKPVSVDRLASIVSALKPSA